jgi:ABC-type amino acid transport substrate-binding protein
VGAVKETSNFEALQYLQKRYNFQAIPFDSLQDLINGLQSHAVNYAVLDRPLASRLISSGAVVVAKELTPELSEYLKDRVGYDDEQYAIATNDRTLRDKVDQLMGEQSIQKQLVSLRQKYGLSKP